MPENIKLEQYPALAALGRVLMESVEPATLAVAIDRDEDDESGFFEQSLGGRKGLIVLFCLVGMGILISSLANSNTPN